MGEGLAFEVRVEGIDGCGVWSRHSGFIEGGVGGGYFSPPPTSTVPPHLHFLSLISFVTCVGVGVGDGRGRESALVDTGTLLIMGSPMRYVLCGI